MKKKLQYQKKKFIKGEQKKNNLNLYTKRKNIYNKIKTKKSIKKENK